MEWYQAILKRILSGVIFFLLPIILLVFILGKAISIVQKLLHPLNALLPEERVLGIGLFTLISLILILVICYIAGILSEGKRVKYFIAKLENNVLIFIPGYSFMKTRAGGAINKSEDHWRVVLVNEDNTWKPGIEIEQQPGGYSTIFSGATRC